MANFDEDIKRITDEILSDGTVDQIIREKVTDGIEKAIASSFNYGKLEKAVKERVEQVLDPFIENYDMSAYIVKLDTVLTEIVNKSVLMDNKQMLENFQYLMKEPQITEMKLTDLFKEYKKFVARNMDTYGRKVEWDESPEYEAMTAFFEFEEDRERIWSSFKYATIDFTVDEEKQQEELNRTIRLSKWNRDRKDGWEIRVDTNPNLNSLRNSEHKQERVPMVDPCYYCLCRSCINNAESLTVNPEEVPYDWHPCFFCDICNNFDGESPENMEREECHEYVIDDYHARQNRKKFRIVR